MVVQDLSCPFVWAEFTILPGSSVRTKGSSLLQWRLDQTLGMGWPRLLKHNPFPVHLQVLSEMLSIHPSVLLRPANTGGGRELGQPGPK